MWAPLDGPKPNSIKVDCAKECPCGVPVIPKPDQWLETYVSGGFKVWHILFIVIALIVALIVFYCCLHRCRIPRTKQEIEADLMRANLAKKFRNCLREFVDVPAGLTEACKRVHELGDKLDKLDHDQSGKRKRSGWLKLGTERGSTANYKSSSGAKTTGEQSAAHLNARAASLNQEGTKIPKAGSADIESGLTRQLVADLEIDKVASSKTQLQAKGSSAGNRNERTSKAKPKASKPTKATRGVDEDPKPELGAELETPTRATRTKRRREKPKLSRTKPVRESRGQSIEHNQLKLPVSKIRKEGTKA